jgi:hypothetical protein
MLAIRTAQNDASGGIQNGLNYDEERYWLMLV